MLHLTDPQLAPLVARYRAWVKEESERRIDQRRWLPGEDFHIAPLITPTYQGFLDWAIREGIEVPKGEG